MTDIGELQLAQEDGGLPTTLVSGPAPGESGISILNVHFQGSAHLSGTLKQHFICFQLSPRLRFDCRIGGRTIEHEPTAGSLAICPAGADWGADSDASVDGLLVAIDPGQLALAASEGSGPRTQLIERFSGEDPVLLARARTLALEAADAYPNGPLFWHDAASEFLHRLLSSHSSTGETLTRASLSKDVLERIKEYIAAHLDEPIEVGALAKISRHSPFHFARMFTRSVGMSPHRYVVGVRLRRAVELLREGRQGMGEIAYRTGFSDQSHLSRWIRRVYGVPPAQLRA